MTHRLLQSALLLGSLSFMAITSLGCAMDSAEEGDESVAEAQDELHAKVKLPPGLPISHPIKITSAPLWTNSGYDLETAPKWIIREARGKWTWGWGSIVGPDGDNTPDLKWDEWITNGRHGQFIGFIGHNPYTVQQNDPRLFEIGTGSVTLTGKSGRLWLGFNDDYESDAIGDNVGEISAFVVEYTK